jgi:hypothetical protein
MHIIRKRHDEAIELAFLGYFDAAMLVVLSTISLVTREHLRIRNGGEIKRNKKGVPQVRDKQEFDNYINRSRAGGVICKDGNSYNFGNLLYEVVRCNLVHEADARIEPESYYTSLKDGRVH